MVSSGSAARNRGAGLTGSRVPAQRLRASRRLVARVKALLMSLLRLPRLAALLLPTACAFVGCTSSRSTGNTSHGDGGDGGGGGTRPHIDHVGPSGPSTGPGEMWGGPEAGAPDVTQHCVGDGGVWEKLTAGPVACQSGEECCVIVNPCLSTSKIVAAANEKEASAAWPSCAVECNDCIARAIDVACVAGSCLGRVVEDAPLSSPLRKDHCGTGLALAEAGGGATATEFTCGLGPGP